MAIIRENTPHPNVTIECSAFRCSWLPDEKIRLIIEQADIASTDPAHLNPNGTRILYVKDVAKILRRVPKTVYKMMYRKRRPLPFTRGRGRPYILESTLYAFLAGEHRPFSRDELLKFVGMPASRPMQEKATAMGGLRTRI